MSDLPFQMRVASAIANAALEEKGYSGMADAAIAIVLEEAAQAVEAMYGRGMTLEHAAAIRALAGGATHE